MAERTVRGFEARVESGSSRPGKGRCLAALAALNRLRELVSRRIDEKVKGGRREGATWTEIASALRVTRQTAHQRYRDPPDRRCRGIGALGASTSGNTDIGV